METSAEMMMMIAFTTFKSSLVPLFEVLWCSNSWEYELSGFRRNRTDDLGIDSPSLWPTEPRLHWVVSISRDYWVYFEITSKSSNSEEVREKARRIRDFLWSKIDPATGVRYCLGTIDKSRLKPGDSSYSSTALWLSCTNQVGRGCWMVTINKLSPLRATAERTGQRNRRKTVWAPGLRVAPLAAQPRQDQHTGTQRYIARENALEGKPCIDAGLCLCD